MNHIKRFDSFKVNENKVRTNKNRKQVNEELLGNLFSSKGRNKDGMKIKLADHLKLYANQAINSNLIKGYDDLEFSDFQSVADKLYEVDFDSNKLEDAKDKAIGSYLMKRCQASVDSTGRKSFGFNIS